MCDPSRWPIFKRLQVAYFERPLTCGTDTLHIKHVLVKHPLGAVILCIMTFGFFAVIWGWNELWGRYICTQCDHT